MEKQRNKTLNEYLKALNIDINELTNYELESLEKTNEYYNDKLSELEEFTKKVNFNGISTSKVLSDVGLGKNVANTHPCIDKFINKRNKEHKTILNDFIYYKTNKITEFARKNKLLKIHDVEHMLLKTEYKQLQKQYNDSLKEIKRLQGLVVKYQNANRSKNSASLN